MRIKVEQSTLTNSVIGPSREVSPTMVTKWTISKKKKANLKNIFNSTFPRPSLAKNAKAEIVKHKEEERSLYEYVEKYSRR